VTKPIKAARLFPLLLTTVLLSALGCTDLTETPSSAITVVVSARRVIGLRHSAPVTRRMAEISVPAWLTPMKKTKFVM